MDYTDRQKEQNQKKLDMLRKVYEEKNEHLMKQTAMLSNVKQQLDEVDAVVASEVDVLRQRITNADKEVAEAEAEFERLEELMKKAAAELQRRQEKKRMLTEHLCIIISETENRKAEKLAELYHRLELEEEEVNVARRELMSAIAEERRTAEGAAHTSAGGGQHARDETGDMAGELGSPPPAGEAEGAEQSFFTGFGVDFVSSTVSTMMGASAQEGGEDAPPDSSAPLPAVDEDEDDEDIPMDQLFQGFSPEEMKDLMK